MDRPVSPPPLPQVDVTIPQWRALDKARRRLDVVRSVTGLLATAAGAVAAAGGMFTPALTGWALLADAVLALGGLATLRLWKPDGQQKAAATALYLTPGVSLAGLLLAEQITPGPHWAEALGLGMWVVGVLVMRPARVARHMLAPPPSPSLDLAPVAEQVGHPACRWWAQHVAVEGGTAPGTVLEDVQRTGESAMRAVIRSATPGRPVPDVSIRNLSALMDIPEDLIDIGPVPGRGAGVRRLTVGMPDDGAEDLETVWAKRIAPAAMPGAVLTGVRVGRPGAGHTATIATSTEEDA